MEPRRLGYLLLIFASMLLSENADAAEKSALRVLYLGRDDVARTGTFREFLQQHFQTVTTASRVDFKPADAVDVDAVVLDWPQSERLTGQYESPLGPLEQWTVPTVFLGSAGLQMAGPWRIIGGAG